MMKQQVTEDYIKSKLDGWFFTIGALGKIVPVAVDTDHIPDHKPRYSMDTEQLPSYMGKKERAWSSDDDELLVSLRQKGMRWEAIRDQLKRGRYQIVARYEMLARERNLPHVQTVPVGPTRIPDALKREIVKLRDAGLPYQEVAVRTGVKPYIARDFYAKFKRMQAQRRAECWL